MASYASEEGSGFPSERYCRDRHSAYKKLLADLAQHLGKEDVKVIVFNCSLSESLKQSSALDVLDYLDKHGKFSPTNIQPLAELLADAYRSDLVNDCVDRYRLKYARHSSVPSSGNRHLPRRRAVYSSPGAYPPVQETGGFPPENYLFSPHEDESACNQSSNEALPQSRIQQMEASGVIHRPFSQPQPPTAMNCAHPKAVHHFNGQMQPEVIQSGLQAPQSVSNRVKKNVMSSASVATTPVNFRRTSTPTYVHQSHRFHNHSREYGTTTQGSVSSSTSMHEMNEYHNPGLPEQELFYGSSAAIANASQDVFSAHHPITRLKHSLSSELSNTHIRSREHNLWYHTQANSSQGSMLSEQVFDDVPPTSTQASQYLTENSLSSESVPSKFVTPTLNGGYTHVFATTPPDFYRPTSSPAATSYSAQKRSSSQSSCFTHASYPRKKTSAAGSTLSDSGVEMVHGKIPPAGPSSDIIEPWMSASNNEQSWIQPRPRVTSVSTGVQTECEDESEKTTSPASGSPRTSSPLQHLHASIESEGCNGGQDKEKEVKVKKHRIKLKLSLAKPQSPKPKHGLNWDLKRNRLNKTIYKHKEQKRITCKRKLELDAGCGGANPRLVFHLIPYGLEDDAGKSATLEIEVEIPRKTRIPMHSATKIRLSVFVQEVKEDGKFLAKHENIEQSIDVSRFFISHFLTHDCLKHSRCDQIEIQASAELIPHSEHPHTPTNSK